MTCPVCVERGLTSLIRTEPFDPAQENAMGLKYWDDGGKLHVHDPNPRQRRYHCTNGHDMLLFQYDPCPSCEFNEGRTEMMVEADHLVAKYRFTKTKEWKKVVTFLAE